MIGARHFYIKRRKFLFAILSPEKKNRRAWRTSDIEIFYTGRIGGNYYGRRLDLAEFILESWSCRPHMRFNLDRRILFLCRVYGPRCR